MNYDNDINFHSKIELSCWPPRLAADFKNKHLILKPKLSDHISKVPQCVFDLNEFQYNYIRNRVVKIAKFVSFQQQNV